MNIFYLILLLGLISSARLAPVSQNGDDFCDGNVLKFQPGSRYFYKYETSALLWISDVSDQAKSDLKLSAQVVVKPKDKCWYVLSLENVQITGDSLTTAQKADAVERLTSDETRFRLNKNGELGQEVKFGSGEKVWSRNVKRGIISAFQVKSQDDLRKADELDPSAEKSAVVYENDVLGRCRTTYKLESSGADSLKLKKTKSLGRCTLNQNSKSSPIQFVPYKNLPEFFHGKLFNEDYECESTVEKGIIKSVECKEKSTYKIGSRGSSGVQAVVTQKLSFDQVSNIDDRKADVSDSYDVSAIAFEIDESVESQLEDKNFNADKFLSDLCANAAKSGLEFNHAVNYKDLVTTIRSKKKAQLLDLYEKSNAKCQLAGLTVVQSIVYCGTDDSFDAILSLLDQDKSFKEQIVINEIPVLTVLTRIQNPSKALIDKLNAYLKGKDASFPYLKKMFLVYSAIIKNYCQKKEGSCKSEAEGWSELFAGYLGADCSESTKTDLISTTLKAIGNVGYFAQKSILEACAAKTSNRNEIRVNAIQALRNFECQDVEGLTGNLAILKNKNEDSELRINAFRVIMNCPESPRLRLLVKDELKQFLKDEEDSQVFTYIVDYGKERGLTTLLNTVLADPEIKEKFAVNFKEQSWNNYRYKYSVLRDGAIEVDTSVIYTPKTFLPRSVNFNVTVHVHGMSVNFMDATVRMEGMDEAIKAVLVEKLTSTKLLERLTEKPEQLAEILTELAGKLKFSDERAYLSLSLRVYGADVFYTELDSGDKLRRAFEAFRDPKQSGVYAQKNVIRNLFLFDTYVQHPLMNGFEFNTRLDAALGILVIGGGNREEAADKSVKFNFNNLYSTSLNVNRRFEVKLCPKNKLSLKKKAVFNLRLRLDADGTRAKGKSLYNINLTQLKSIPILTIDAKFYKLSTGGEYVEVKDFKIEQKQYSNCTSPNFRSATGVDLCLTFNRPSLTSLKDIISPIDLNQIPDDDNDDDDEENGSNDDDDDEDDDIDKSAKRPRSTLTGPYHYEVTIANPDLIKTLILEANYNRENDEVDFQAKLKTKSSADKVEDRLQLALKRERKVTNRGLTRSFDLDLKNLKSGESRLHVVGRFVYKKEEELTVFFKLDNKILREITYSFEVSRIKNEDNMTPSYKLESILDSKLVDHKQFRLILDSVCQQKDIKANLVLELSGPETGFNQFEVFDGIIELKSNNDDTDSIDHELSVHFETYAGRVIEIHGPVSIEALKSNVELTFKHSKDEKDLEFTVKTGHAVDLSGEGKSSVEFLVTAPARNVNYGLAALVDADVTNQRINGLELHISTPRNLGKKPYIVEISKKSTFDEEDPAKPFTNTYHLAVRNMNLDLSTQQSFAIKMINRIGDTAVVQDAELEIVANRERHRKHDMTITLKKNSLPVLTVKTNLYGNLRELRRADPTELAKQELGAALDFKFISYSGNGKATLVLERSDKKQLHNYSFNLKTEKFLKAIVGIGEINFAHNSEPGKFNAKFEITKEGDVKSIVIKSSGPLRVGGVANINGVDHKELEYDVTSEKTLATTEVRKSSGVMKLKFNSFKNFVAELNMDNNFAAKIVSQNQRNADQQESLLGNLHNIEFSYRRVDIDPVEKLYKLSFTKDTSSGNSKKISIEIAAQKGAPNKLAETDKLDFNVLVKSKAVIPNENNYFLGIPRIQDRTTNVVFASKKFNLNAKFDADLKYDVAGNQVTYSEKLVARFPIENQKMNDFVAEFSLKRSLDHKTASIRFKRSSDSQYITGKLFKAVEAAYDRTTTADGKANIKLNVDLTRRTDSDRMVAPVENVNIDLTTGCFVSSCGNTKIRVQQTLKPIYTTRFLEYGTNLDIKDCTYERKQGAEKVDVDMSLKCGQKLVLANRVFAKHSRDEQTDLPSTKFELVLTSDFKMANNHLKFEHNKFNKRNGLLEASYAVLGSDASSLSLSYNRALDPATGKLVTGKYKIAVALDKQTTKKCEMNIESKVDYFNVLNCALTSARIPGNVPLNYGYSLKIAKVEDYQLFGKRSLDFNIQLPTGRLLRAVYKSDRATPIADAQFDKDNDDNNDREFNSTVKLYWDAKKDETKYIELSIKRDNVAQGKFVVTVDVLNHPHFKTLRLQYTKERKLIETYINAAIIYELAKGGASNRLDVTSRMTSTIDTSSSIFEFNLVRPSLNARYESRIDKRNGRLKYLAVRLAKLLQLVVDKEYDPDNRSIALELSNPDESKFAVETVKSREGDFVVSTSTLSSKAGVKLSVLTSKFDTRNNKLSVNINGVATKNQYDLNLGIFSETLANAFITDQSKKILGQAFLYVADADNDAKELVFELKWNRLWGKIQSDLVGGQELEGKCKQSAEFNSYFGDCFGQLKAELKDAYTDTRKTRQEVFDDIGKFFLLQLEFYSKLFPSLRNSDALKAYAAAQVTESGQKIEDLPLQKRIYIKYNALADRLTTLSLALRKISKNLSKAVPRLPKISFEIDEGKNHLKMTRPTFNAETLYQFNAEYRDFYRSIGERILNYKGDSLLNKNLASVKALINKYKYRSLKDHTLVASVYKGRNVVAFNGKSTLLATPCEFLLAHDAAKNRFSVLLDNKQAGEPVIKVVLAGAKTITVGVTATKITVDGVAVSLPRSLKLNNNNNVTLGRGEGGVYVSFNKEAWIACYEDSSSCTLSFTRFFTGRIQGMLGGTENNNFAKLPYEGDWMVKQCPQTRALPRPSSDEAVKKCYAIFGKHKRTPLRDAFLAVNPDGWRKVCERALTADPNSKCSIISAYVRAARIEGADVNVPNECFTCQNKNLGKTYNLNAFIPKAESSQASFDKGSDYVFMVLPCESSKYALDYAALLKKANFLKPGDRYAVVRVEKYSASIVQSNKQETSNFDLASVAESMSIKETTDVETKAFLKGLFLAESLFAKRVAQNRHLIIKSCGNCLSYSIGLSLKLNKIVSELGVTVTSIGDYDMQIGEENEDSVPIAYDEEKLYSAKTTSSEVESDSLESYKVVHKADLCQRMAVKSHGMVININKIRDQKLLAKVPEWLEHVGKEHSTRARVCERVDTPLGDIADFRFVKSEAHSD